MRSIFTWCLIILALHVVCTPRPGQAADNAGDKAADKAGADRVDFARQILPILSNKCFICHGPDMRKKGLVRLDSFEGATRDLDGYKAIDPADLAKSEILVRIHDADDPMPPKKSDRQLTAAERDLISRWIKQGGTYAKHWAFVPPKKSQPPSITKGLNQSHGAIDSFVGSQLQSKGIDFAPATDRATLARRAALVLTGLPPEPAQLKTFLTDIRADAYERYVDQLLASERYGEHQARFWLDAVRYGDTHGLHLDNKRGIYPYRDWVILALNRNQRLDEFLTWQMAGDLLPNSTLEQQVATGFVRMNPSTAEGGAIPAEFQAKNNFDRVESIGTMLYGMTLTCARCHTHKYDPISHTEYYQLFAFFNSTSESPMDGNSYTYGPVLKAPEDVNAWKRWFTLIKERDALLSKITNGPTKDAGKDVSKAALNWSHLSDDAKLTLLANAKGPLAKHANHTEAVALSAKFAAAQKTFTTTLVTKELPKPRKTQLLDRGEYNLPVGDALQPDVFAVMGKMHAKTPRNRLGLAQWSTSRDHPLVARVLVNRIWQSVFGYGLVRTPEDFGLQGEQPTHPELLDWLAVELHDSKWNLKQMLKRMVTSRTFKQSSKWREDANDPGNRLFARGPSYRLDAEVLRDIALWSSNMMDPTMGGPGVKPYQPSGMWLALAHPGSNTKKYIRDKGERLYRRSLYVYWKRTSPHPMMSLFDAPNRESSCVGRSRTNTPLQSLGLLNETQRIELARKLAERLMKEAKNDAGRLDLLFTLLASRQPSASERATCMKLLKQLTTRYAGNEKDALALLSTGDAPRDEKLNAAQLAAWTQLAATALASELAIVLY